MEMEMEKEKGVGTRLRTVLHKLPGLLLYEDGVVERCPPPLLPASSEFDVDGVATKDVTINPDKGTWVRIFLPRSAAHDEIPSSSRSAPLVLHFHGGGMCFGSPAEPMYHIFCSRMASASNTIWISIHYRLAPEHRLPAQYQDCFEALCWLHSQFATTAKLSPISTSGHREPWELEEEDTISGERERWVVDYGDPARVFCVGESAGATILHFVALKMVKHEWNPLNIRGLIFVDIGVLTDPLPEMTPFTDSTLTTKMMADSVALSLPVGGKLGDALLDCLHPDSKCHFKLGWPPILLLSAERDLLREGVLRYYTFLKEAGKDAELYESQGKGHCFHLVERESEAAQLRESTMVLFMRKL
ncbi:hypothetical protein GOP47_0011760 [Adiantum capillus-veneris]|uniref:Alpha/beta hydrolase fold-3 domain-containing protein n=1 Tax=Adiantum capillus-veneris TaxID=13818 RepID=A0A9D4ZH26_ADICA|nr:hypothetical protein GOP47_0011760 [Adiantum capillus-veneris]